MIDVYYCQSGALRVYGLDEVLQLSVRQLRILAELYHDPQIAPAACVRKRLHAALGHQTMPRGPRPRGSDGRERQPLRPGQRAALSRALRRLHPHGLLERSRTCIAPTAVGAGFMTELRALPLWKRWSRDWMPGANGGEGGSQEAVSVEQGGASPRRPSEEIR